jgi:hypothetical protein
MGLHVPPDILDNILALQIAVAWAGEGACEPPRLGWWQTDLIDQEGGGDLLVRLLPKTHRWASLEAVRQCAIQVDRRKRLEMAHPDDVRTLFFWGFSLDERLADRLQDLKQHGDAPENVLAFPFALAADFSESDFETAIAPTPQKNFTVAPQGRQMKGTMPESYDQCACELAAALFPLASDYPMPFYRIEPS